MKTLSLILVFVLWCGDVMAGHGFNCPRGGKKYYNSYFDEQNLTKTDICIDSNGEVKIASGESYADTNCLKYGWKDYSKFETDFWGNYKCNEACREKIDALEYAEAMKACKKRPLGDYAKRKRRIEAHKTLNPSDVQKFEILWSDYIKRKKNEGLFKDGKI